jgi:hypothetical protein
MEKKRNLWVIPTDKPTYLYEMEGKLHLSDKFEKGNEFWHNQNICITNSEEIKEGDWCIHTELHDLYFKDNNSIEYPAFKKYYKKIILTTDQDLIKDGIQAIDDEFLEWFMKNPACEEVKIEDYGNLYNFRYLVLIPQEEPKFEDSIENSINIMSIANSMFSKKEEPKQETLEEAADSYSSNPIFRMGTPRQDMKRGFELGAKWQQEQDKKLYSEEDMYKAYHCGRLYQGREGDTTFEQFIRTI